VGAVSFEQAREALREAGLRERSAEYSQQTFGSWWIEAEGTRSFRVVWDGHEGWLVLQAGSPEGRWTDLWLAREGADQSSGALLRAIASAEN
jgi:hypothetical protein